MSWPKLRVGDISTVVTKGTTPTKTQGFADIGVNFIKAEALNGDSALDPKGIFHISDEVNQKLKRSILQEDDVLLTIAGVQIGKCGIVRSSHLPGNTNQAVGIIRVERSKADPRYVYYWFKQPHTFAFVQGLNAQAAQPNINLSMLKNIEIPILPVPLQGRIASILSAYDDLIENNRRRIQLLEQAARLLYKEWFVHFRFPGHEHVKIRNGVPEGWEKKALGEICLDIRESVLPKNLPPMTPYIGLEHIPRRSITLSEWGHAEGVTSQKFLFSEGDILFGKIRPYFHKVGFTLTDGITSSDAIVIRTLDDELYEYCLLLLSSDEFVAFASKTVKEGSKMPRADWKYLMKCTFLLPPRTLTGAMSDVVSPVLKQLRILAAQTRQLSLARDLMLPRLMNGDIAV